MLSRCPSFAWLLRIRRPGTFPSGFGVQPVLGVYVRSIMVPGPYVQGPVAEIGPWYVGIRVAEGKVVNVPRGALYYTFGGNLSGVVTGRTTGACEAFPGYAPGVYPIVRTCQDFWMTTGRPRFLALGLDQ